MARTDVQRVYSFRQAGWYDKYKKLWNRVFASKAEDELKFFLEKNINKNKSILELGCGTALNLEKIYSMNLKFKKYLGLDFSMDMLKIANNKFSGKPNVMFLEKDITTLNIKEKYDIILCTWVLSHLDIPSDVVNNAQKLLSKNGKMFIIFFTKPKWYVHFWVYPYAKYIFRASYVQPDEIKRFKNVNSMHRYFADLVTTAAISK